MAAQGSSVTVLGLETSCDETAAAIVRLTGAEVEVLSDVIASQIDIHADFGGVVPEIAARAHVEKADHVVRQALSDAELGLGDLDAIAATAGPGLIGGVMVGLMTAKALALATGKPLVAVNHLEGHALSPRLSGQCAFPYLLLLVSGGHCQFLHVRGLGDYERLGSTIDDAVGEAFDKTAKLLGLGFPGGPAVEACACEGDADAIDLPRPLLDRPGLDLSFAGLKTAVRRAADQSDRSEKARADICASFQAAVTEILTEKTRRAMGKVASGGTRRLVVAGGVAANSALRTSLERLCDHTGFIFHAPPMRWCTDNGAMIALAGAERFRAGFTSDPTVEARPRWPLDENRAVSDPVYGGGRKGAKA